CRPSSQGRKARRPTDSAGHQGRAVHQPEDRQGSWPRHSEHTSWARGRGVRMTIFFAAMHESAIGPQRTCACELHVSAFAGKADINSATVLINIYVRLRHTKRRE